MTNDIELYAADIRSNTDKLSAKVIHDGLVKFTKDELIIGETMMKAFVAAGGKGRSVGDLEAHVGHKGPIDAELLIEGSVGIPEIHKADESSVLSGKYPIFVDKGTGIYGDRGDEIFAKENKFMKIPPERGEPGYLRKSKGQEGKHYLLATFLTMAATMQTTGESFKADLTAKLSADKSL